MSLDLVRIVSATYSLVKQAARTPRIESELDWFPGDRGSHASWRLEGVPANSNPRSPLLGRECKPDFASLSLYLPQGEEGKQCHSRFDGHYSGGHCYGFLVSVTRCNVGFRRRPSVSALVLCFGARCFGLDVVVVRTGGISSWLTVEYCHFSNNQVLTLNATTELPMLNEPHRGEE